MLRYTLAAAGLLAAFATPAFAQTADFAGKKINIIVGFGPGGGYDTNSRLLARHLGKHVPGNPDILVQNMPGAGALRAANYIYNVSPKDGTELGVFASSNALEPLFGNAAAKFTTSGFTWIGNMHRDYTSCGVWTKSGITSLEDLRKRPGRFGGSGPSAITTQHPLAIKNMLGLDIQIVQGYKGTREIYMAMEKAEVDGTCAMFVSNLQGPYAEHIKSGAFKIILQKGRKDHPAYGGAPNLYNLLKSEEEKQLADFIFRQTEIARPVAGPPGIPANIAATLRKAFDATMRDPALLAEGRKMGIEFEPMDAAELEKTYAAFAATPKHLIERAKTIMSQ
ncbi:MAG: hypothetical protein FJX29_05025 [Alphaproteobacteria bacterium]|nr:hypothetical protein [Alphaproteobacteria bacterium]